MRTVIKILLLLFISKGYAQITLIQKIPTNGLPPHSMTISKDNEYAFVGAGSTIQVFKRNKLTGILNLTSSVDSIHFLGNYLYSAIVSPDSNYLYTSLDRYLSTFKINKLTGNLTKIETVNYNVTPTSLPTTTSGMAMSKDNKDLYRSHRDQIFHFRRNLITGKLTLVDTIKEVNYQPNYSYDIAIELSHNNKTLYATGLHSISVFKRDTSNGNLQLYQRLDNSSLQNQSLNNVTESKLGVNGKYLYTLSRYNGITKSEINHLTDSIDPVNSITCCGFNRPDYLSLTPNGKGMCVVSYEEAIFYKIDSINGDLTLVRKYPKLSAHDKSLIGKKVFDNEGSFMYSIPSFTDTIYVYKLDRPLFDYPDSTLPITSINNSFNNKGIVTSIFPTPNKGDFFVNLSDYYDGIIIIRNLTGQIIKEVPFKKAISVHVDEIKTPGLYLIEINIGTNKFIFKTITIN